MKKQSMRGGLLLLCAVLCLAMMIGGCVKQPEAPSSSAAAPEASEQAPELSEEKMEHMLPILEGIALAAESGKIYDSQDAEQFWHMLYSVAYCNGEQGQEAVWQEGGDLSVSKALMERYAAACFEGFSKLPEVPAEFEQVSYEESTGKYLLKNTEQSETYAKIYSVQEMTQGIYRVDLNLFAGDDELPYEQYEFILVGSHSQEQGGEPSFDYCVRQAKKFEMDPGSMAR